MAGIVNDYLIFPILDLVQKELQNYTKNLKDNDLQVLFDNPFAGIPSTSIERNHPDDTGETIITGVRMVYNSGFAINLGFEYDENFILQIVNVTVASSKSQVVAVYRMVLNRDGRGLITSTSVARTQGLEDVSF